MMLRVFAAVLVTALAGVLMAAGGASAADVSQAAGAPQDPQASQAAEPPETPSTSQTPTQQQPPSQSTGQASATTQNGQADTTSHSSHFVTLRFDYDFTKTPACSATVKTACVKEFVAYDISAGVKHRRKLFVIPLPPKPVGVVHRIKGRSPTKLDFESGKHLISVSAREPGDKESKHRACTTWIDIP